MPELLAACLLAAAMGISPSQNAAPAAAAPSADAPAKAAGAPQEDPAVTALARKIYAQMRAGKVDEALLTPAMSRHLSPEVLAQTRPIFDQLGDPTALALETRETVAAGTIFQYLATFRAAQMHVRILVVADGRVGEYSLSM